MNCRLTNPEVLYKTKTYVCCCECGKWFPLKQNQEEIKRRVGELVCSYDCFSGKLIREEVELLQSLML